MEIVGIYEDAGKSGKSIEGRPAFKKMLSDIKNGLEIDYILVYKLSRFGRNAADILNSLEFVQSYGINLICIEEGIDSSQTSGKLLISVLSAVAEIERENIIEQTMNGRQRESIHHLPRQHILDSRDLAFFVQVYESVYQHFSVDAEIF